MQISSSQFYQSQVSSMGTLQSRIGQLQDEISSGKQLTQPSDDPAGFVKVTQLTQSQASLTQFNKNINVANQRLTQTDTILSQAVNVTTRLQELAIQGANDTNSPASRQAIGAEMTQLSSQLVSLGNSVDSNGDPIFAGYKTNTDAFTTLSDGTVQFNGDTGRNEVAIAKGVTTPTTSSGTEVFMQIPQAQINQQIVATAPTTPIQFPQTLEVKSGNTPFTLSITGTSGSDKTSGISWSTNANGQLVLAASSPTSPVSVVADTPAGLAGAKALGFLDSNSTPIYTNIPASTSNNGSTSIFAMIQKATAELNAGLPCTSSVGDFQNAVSHLSTYQTICGARLQKITGIQQANTTAIQSAQQVQSGIQDTDIASAATELSQQELNLSASETSFAKISQMSLFNYIK